MLSLIGSGVIGPASIAPGAELAPRAKAEAAPGPEEERFFETRVRPLLIKRCYRCHSSEAKILKGGLHLDSRAGILRDAWPDRN